MFTLQLGISLGLASAETHQGNPSINHPSQPPSQHPLLPARPGTRRAQASSYCLQVSTKGRDLKNFHGCQGRQSHTTTQLLHRLQPTPDCEAFITVMALVALFSALAAAAVDSLLFSIQPISPLSHIGPGQVPASRTRYLHRRKIIKSCSSRLHVDEAIPRRI